MAHHFKNIIEKIQADPRYQRNIEYGEPRSGHPEGKVRIHIELLENNLELLKPRGISSADYWKLKFLIHVHDTFKAEAQQDVPVLHPRSHATLAREYANQFTEDRDLLNMIQYHDDVYYLWRELLETGSYDQDRFQALLRTIQDWDLFLMFVIIDGCTQGKDYGKLTWFIGEVRKYKETVVDEAWILSPSTIQ